MEALMSWTRWFGIKLFKNKKIKLGEVKAEQNKVLCAEQLSRRLKEDIGLEDESSDTSSYTKYL